jgi:hypothetical protein
MIIKRKDQETIQAQVEHFSDIGIEEFSSDHKLLLEYSSQLAKINNLNQIPEDFPKELKDLIAINKDAYIMYLREHRVKEREFLKSNLILYKGKFQNTVNELKEKILRAENPREIEEFIGSGSNGDAYKIVIENEKLVVKFSRYLTQNNFEIKPLIRAKDVSHTPNLIAFSLSDGVKIMSLLPGKEVTSFTPEDNIEYPDERIIRLIEIVLKLESNGIVIDPKASNFLYDQKEGFSILDFHLSNGSSFCEPQQQVMSLINALSSKKFPQVSYEDDEAYQNQRIEKGKIYFSMLIRFLTIMNLHYPKLLQRWKDQLEEHRENPRIEVSELVDRDNWPTEDQEINNYINTLEQMGY